MPSRIIKESIRTSKKVNNMTDFQFRLWTYLITFVDDYGRGSADPELIKGFVFPRRKNVTEATIEKTLAELATMGSLLLYEVDGEAYLCFPNWSEHQTIRNKVSKFPAPEDGKTTIEFNCNQLHANVPVIQSNPNPIQTLSNESVTRACAKKSAYGSYKNVKLTDAELETLRKDYPNADEAIEFLSEYIERKDYKAKSHYLTLKNWVFDALKERKAKNKATETLGNFDTNDFFDAALKRSYSEDGDV